MEHKPLGHFRSLLFPWMFRFWCSPTRTPPGRSSCPTWPRDAPRSRSSSASVARRSEIRLAAQKSVSSIGGRNFLECITNLHHHTTPERLWDFPAWILSLLFCFLTAMLVSRLIGASRKFMCHIACYQELGELFWDRGAPRPHSWGFSVVAVPFLISTHQSDISSRHSVFLGQVSFQKPRMYNLGIVGHIVLHNLWNIIKNLLENASQYHALRTWASHT